MTKPLNELSKKLLGRYVTWASHDAIKNAYAAADNRAKKGNFAAGTKEVGKVIKRHKGIQQATDRLTKEETEEQIMETNALDALTHAVTGNMVDFKSSIDEILVGKISDALEVERISVARGMFETPESTEE